MTDRPGNSGGTGSHERALVKSMVPCEPGAGTLVEVLRSAAAERPQALYINLLADQSKSVGLTFSQVLQGAERWARWLIARGIGRGDLRPDANADIATELLVGPVYFRLVFGGELHEEFANEIVDNVMRGYRS